MLLCKVVSAVALVLASVLILFCNAVSAATRALASATTLACNDASAVVARVISLLKLLLAVELSEPIALTKLLSEF